ncbi:873_t:CDS:2, partial [Ambispora leptoticha]
LTNQKSLSLQQLQNSFNSSATSQAGAKKLLVIRCLGGSNRRYSRIGDLVIATVKKAEPNSNIKKGQVVMALIVTTRKYFHRHNNSWVKFSKNYAVLVKKEDKEPVAPELKSGDMVRIITGKYRGTIDYISRIDPKNQIVYLKKANKKKYDKSTPENKKKSELKEIMVPIHVSNVAY